MTFTTIPFKYEINGARLENIKKWIVALRSGKYAQLRQSLTNPEHDSFCCLGVACEEQEIPFDCGMYVFGQTNLNLTPQYSWFQDTYGFVYDQEVVTCDYDAQTLMHLNDKFQADFNKIADVIEAVFVNRLQLDIEI